jgi:hypothetical protein
MREESFLVREKSFLMREELFLMRERFFLRRKKVFLMREESFLVRKKVFLRRNAGDCHYGRKKERQPCAAMAQSAQSAAPYNPPSVTRSCSAG